MKRKDCGCDTLSPTVSRRKQARGLYPVHPFSLTLKPNCFKKLVFSGVNHSLVTDRLELFPRGRALINDKPIYIYIYATDFICNLIEITSFLKSTRFPS